MLSKEIINKMNEDELRNYVYHLQNYIKVAREINLTRKAYEDNLIRLLSQREDLSILTIRENNQTNRLARLTEEMEGKYSSTYSIKDDTIWAGEVCYGSEE